MEAESLLSQGISLLLSTLRVSTPLLLAALGGLMSERSGVINIALEGLMLVGAFAAASVAHATGQGWLGMAAAGLAGGLLSLLYGVFVIRLRSDQIVAGTAINLLAVGITPFLCKVFFDSTSASPSLASAARLGWGPTVFAIASVGVLHHWIWRMRSGVWVRFAGENPQTLESQGISVIRVRWGAVTVAGILAGLGGGVLSVALASSFSRNMTAGRGFMALAALIFGKWMPVPTLLACLFFGFTEALQIRLQGVVLWGTEAVPVQFIQVLPYLVTILVLAGFVGQSRAPKALGLPFPKR